MVLFALVAQDHFIFDGGGMWKSGTESVLRKSFYFPQFIHPLKHINKIAVKNYISLPSKCQKLANIICYLKMQNFLWAIWWILWVTRPGAITLGRHDGSTDDLIHQEHVNACSVSLVPGESRILIVTLPIPLNPLEMWTEQEQCWSQICFERFLRNG